MVICCPMSGPFEYKFNDVFADDMLLVDRQCEIPMFVSFLKVLFCSQCFALTLDLLQLVTQAIYFITFILFLCNMTLISRQFYPKL